jgi:hypothetical protein
VNHTHEILAESYRETLLEATKRLTEATDTQEAELAGEALSAMTGVMKATVADLMESDLDFRGGRDVHDFYVRAGLGSRGV